MFHVMSFGLLRWVRESASASASPPASTIKRMSLGPFEHTGAPVSRLLLPQHPGQRMHASGHICVSGCTRLILVLCLLAGLSHDPILLSHLKVHTIGATTKRRCKTNKSLGRCSDLARRQPDNGILIMAYFCECCRLLPRFPSARREWCCRLSRLAASSSSHPG